MEQPPLSPIGVFDSGIGGLTVVRQIMHAIPNEHIIYIGDTARLPYGAKAGKTIVRYAIENTLFLLDKNVKMLVVACHTAASHSAEKLRQFFKLPVIDIIEAGLAAVAAATTHQRIGVLATQSTVQSGIYESRIRSMLPQAVVTSVACPMLVPLIEEGFTHHPAAALVVKDYLETLKAKNIDTLLLGCTHYPLLSHLIANELGPHVKIIDPAAECASSVAKALTSKNNPCELSHPAAHQFFVSDDPEKFGRLAHTFLGSPLSHVEKFSWPF